MILRTVVADCWVALRFQSHARIHLVRGAFSDGSRRGLRHSGPQCFRFVPPVRFELPGHQGFFRSCRAFRTVSTTLVTVPVTWYLLAYGRYFLLYPRDQ